MNAELQRYTLDRTGRPPLTFEGECLAAAYGDDLVADPKRRDLRWHELEVYRTRSGTYVLSVRYRTDWPGEIGHDLVTLLDRPEHVVKHLGTVDPLRHVRGYPPDTHFADKQERLLAEIRVRYDRCVSELFGGLGPEFAERVE